MFRKLVPNVNAVLSQQLWGEELLEEGDITNSTGVTITYIVNGVSIVSDGSDPSPWLASIDWNSSPNGKYRMQVQKDTISGTANMKLEIGDTTYILEEDKKELIKFTHEQANNIKISFDGTEAFEAVVYITLKGVKTNSLTFDDLLANSKVYESVLPFTPPFPLYSGADSYGSSIIENDTYIFSLFNDTEDGNYVHHNIARYNKITKVVDYQQITTTNGYGLDTHKLPSGLITSSGSLLIAIERLISNGAHNSIVEIFRWVDPSDLTTYTITTVGNNTTERLAYQYLYETSAGVILEARRYSGTPQWRNYYISNNDGVSFGSLNEYINYGDSDYWIYTAQVGNNNLGDIILAIKPQNDQNNANCYQYVTFLRTDFTGNFYSLDGTNLGTVVTGIELETYSSWGDINKNNLYYDLFTSKIVGDKIINVGAIGTRTSSTISLDYLQFFITDINTGAVYLGNEIEYNITSQGALLNIGNKLYFKTTVDGDIHYYEVATDFNSMNLVKVESGNYSTIYSKDIDSELTMDYDSVTNTYRIFRTDNPDNLSILEWCSVSSPSIEPTVIVDSLMDTITFTTYNITGIGTPTNLPAGITASYSNNLITVEGTPTETGIFNYEIPLIGCTNIAQGTITVNEAPQTNLLSDLVSIWELDEISGTVVNDSYSTNNGTNNGATVNQTSVTNLGTSYSFDGLNDYLSIPHNAELNFNTGIEDFSCSVWINSSSASVQATIKKWSGAGGTPYPISLLFTDTVAQPYMFDGSNLTGGNYSIALLDGMWHHIVVTIDHTAGNMYLYVDGVLENTYPINPLMGSTANSANINISGNDQSPTTQFWNGTIDQVALWRNRALSLTDIQDLYNLGNGLPFNQW